MLGPDFKWDHLPDPEERQRHHHQLVEEADARDEIRDRVDRAGDVQG
jgi:hypothetical protein